MTALEVRLESVDPGIFPPDDPEPGEPRERTSWWPRPLVAAGAPIEPTILHRDDGEALLYPGRLHAVVGESESCKTWFTLMAVVDVVNRAGHVLIVDFEDVEQTAHGRLTALGLTDFELGEHVHFLHPDEPLLERHGKVTPGQMDLLELLETWPMQLAIFDGVTEGMGLEGMNPLDNADVASWYRQVVRRTTKRGAATVVVDHVTKSKEERGRYAIGGVHKLNGLDGAGYSLEAIEPLAPGHVGAIRVTVAKDRPGAVRAYALDRKRVGVLTLDARGAGVVAALEPPDEEAVFLPTRLMAKVSAYLEVYEGATKTSMRSGIRGKNEFLDDAIDALVGRGHVAVKREGNTHRHYLQKPYVSDLDDE